MKKFLSVISIFIFILGFGQIDNIADGESITLRIHYGFLNAGQKRIFHQHFQDKQTYILNKESLNFTSNNNRLALIFFKLCMIISALRFVEERIEPNKLVCTDADFDNCLKLIDIYFQHSLYNFKSLNLKKIMRSKGILFPQFMKSL